jgi:hypothetical protein
MRIFCNKTNNIWWCEPDNSLPTRNFRFRLNQHDPSTVNWRLADYKQQTQTTGLIQYHVGYTFIISSLYGQDQQILLALYIASFHSASYNIILETSGIVITLFE